MKVANHLRGALSLLGVLCALGAPLQGHLGNRTDQRVAELEEEVTHWKFEARKSKHREQTAWDAARKAREEARQLRLHAQSTEADCLRWLLSDLSD